jgi:hypothetical protein
MIADLKKMPKTRWLSISRAKTEIAYATMCFEQFLRHSVSDLYVSVMISNMIKQAAQKQAFPSRSKLIKLVLLGVLITVLIFSIVAVLAYRNRKSDTQAADQKALVADKAKFAAVEQDMDKAYADIIAVIGKPQVEDKGKSCARANLKFAEGNLSCSIMFTFAYPEQNYADSYAKTMKLQDTLKRSPYYIDSSDNVFNPHLSSEDKKDVTSDLGLTSPHDVHCAVMYSYTEPHFYSHAGYDLSAIKSEYFSFYQYRCASDVKLAVYP